MKTENREIVERNRASSQNINRIKLPIQIEFFTGKHTSTQISGKRLGERDTTLCNCDFCKCPKGMNDNVEVAAGVYQKLKD